MCEWCHVFIRFSSDQNLVATSGPFHMFDRSEGLSLWDMLSLGAWRMGLGCSGLVLSVVGVAAVVIARVDYTSSRNKSSLFSDGR